jgi:uncharacterized protein DUF4386
VTRPAVPALPASTPPTRTKRLEIAVNSTRKVSIATGTLLIVATVAVLAASAVDPTLTGAGYLTEVAIHPHRLAAAALLYLVAAGASVGIAIALYPVLKRVHSGLALGAVTFRAIEATLYATVVVAVLSVLPLGQALTTAQPADQGSIRAIADSLLSARPFQSRGDLRLQRRGSDVLRLVLPVSTRAALAVGLGIAGVLLMISACLMALFSDSPITSYTLLVLPIAVQELVLAFWLLVKGFRSFTDVPTHLVGGREDPR